MQRERTCGERRWTLKRLRRRWERDGCVGADGGRRGCGGGVRHGDDVVTVRAANLEGTRRAGEGDFAAAALRSD
jgi:hypothetical protein